MSLGKKVEKGTPENRKALQRKYSRFCVTELCFSVDQLCPTLCDPINCSTPSFPVFHYLLELAQTYVHWIYDAIQPSHSVSSPFSSCPQPFPESGSVPMSQFFLTGGQSIGSFSFSISPSNEYSGLLSFMIDWLDLLAVQGTLKSLHQHHRSKVSILWSPVFLMAQFSHPYMTTGKTIALTIQGFIREVMPLFLNNLSRFVITFLPRSKCL